MADNIPQNPPPKGGRLVLVLAGAFCSFAPIGPLMQMVGSPPGEWAKAVVGAVISGMIAVGWASVFMFGRYLLLIPLIIAQAVGPPAIFFAAARLGITSIGSGVDPQTRQIVHAIMAVVFMAAGYFLIIRYTELQEREATRSRTELDLAAGIHRTLVPAIDFRVPGIHILGRSDPSSQMGGDLIDVVSEKGRFDVYLADVAGHGVKAGVVMAMVKAAIRMRLRNASELGGLLTDLDAVLQQTIEPGMFATFACMRFTPSGAVGAPVEVRASFALAGHLPILHYSAARRAVVDLPNDALPLGVGENELYSEQDLLCQAGDTFLLITDGLTEVAGPDGRQFGLARIREHLAAKGGSPLAELHQSLLESARRHGPQIDDQTLLLVRIGA